MIETFILRCQEAVPRGGQGRNAILLALLVFLVAAISVHDAMLLVLNQLVIVEYEKNPVGRWLLAVSDGDVWPFVVVKLVCTAVVCATVVGTYERSPRVGLSVAAALALFQLAVVWYLCLA